MKRLFALLVLPLLALSAWGQMNATGFVDKTYYGWGSNISDCKTATDCWNHFATTGVRVGSGNGRNFVIDSAGHVSEYDQVTHVWSTHPEYGVVYKVLAGGDGNIYGLVTYNTAGKGYYISQWTSSGWKTRECCFKNFAMATGNDGTIIAHDVNGTMWLSTDYGVTVGAIPFCYAVSEAVLGRDTNHNPSYAVVCNDGKIWEYVKSTWTQLPGAGLAIAAGGGSMYVIDSNHAIDHWHGTGWDLINAWASSLAVGGQLDVWIIGQDGHAENFWEVGMNAHGNYHGSVDCGTLFQGPCLASHHTATVNFTFNGKTVQANTQFQGPGKFSIDSPNILKHDAWSCFVGTNCTGTTAGNTECSSSGPINNPSSGWSFKVEYAKTRVNLSGPPVWSPSPDGFNWFYYYSPVYEACTNTYTPDFMPGQVAGVHSDSVQADVSSLCWSINHAPWNCLGQGATVEPDAEYPIYIGSTHCDANTP